MIDYREFEIAVLKIALEKVCDKYVRMESLQYHSEDEFAEMSKELYSHSIGEASEEVCK